MTSPIKVGISSCLLGERVRYDGGHKQSTLCLQELAQLFEFVPTCPEAGAGLGVPRPAVRLVGDPAAPRARGIDDPALDVTERLQAFARARVPQLDELCGYVFIRNSPSCGLVDVKLYDANGMLQQATSRGIFASAIVAAYPLLPVEEEGRLHDPLLRESFVTRVFALHGWRELLRRGLNPAALREFHAPYSRVLGTQGADICAMLDAIDADDIARSSERYIAALLHGLQPREH